MLNINNLSVNFKLPNGIFQAVKSANLSLKKGELVALVGESGSGKSVLALSVMRLLPNKIASHPNGSINLLGKELISLTEKEMCSIRGNKVSMIFQEPMTSLNPLHNIEKQISETLITHKKMDKIKARERVIELLKLVGLDSLIERLDAYPHNLSGGQRQRIMIAMALANEPDLLIADEPTTALDVTIQLQILNLLKNIQKRTGMAILIITHNLTLVENMCDRVYVMQKGEIIENGEISTIFTNPKQEYTKHLLNSEPKGHAIKLEKNTPILMETANLNVSFTLKKNFFGKPIASLRAVQNASLHIRTGETLGIVGESGSGKTTLAMAMLRLTTSSGKIFFNNNRIDKEKGKDLRPLRKEMQIVFQDPFASLNPRMSIGQIVAEGLRAHYPSISLNEEEAAINRVLKEVGLDENHKNRYPHEFSGGQRQRIAIARTLVLKPKLIVLDEPTSALDVTIQLQILELLKELQRNYKISYIFISHDLAVVKSISHRIVVMQHGKIIEENSTDNIFSHPANDYTKKLIKASFLK